MKNQRWFKRLFGSKKGRKMHRKHVRAHYTKDWNKPRYRRYKHGFNR